mgnify:CR=1 FL=1|tara:strand:+ start:562 stop:807 length:246 start_codon:yes stop_codon:yes gene_type:complete
MDSWRDYRKSLNEIEAYQKAVRKNWEEDEDWYTKGGPESGGVAYPHDPPSGVPKSAAPGFGGSLEEDAEEIEEEEDGILED